MVCLRRGVRLQDRDSSGRFARGIFNIVACTLIAATGTTGQALAQNSGSWTPPDNWNEIAVHLTLLHSGKILWWGWDGRGATYLWDPVSNVHSPRMASCGADLFCAGHSTLADGRVIVVGGTEPNASAEGIPDASVFDPLMEKWTRRASMKTGRWYPTSTTLSDGRILAASGNTETGEINMIPEIYNPWSNTWTLLPSALLPSLALYPFDFVLPDGRVLYAGSTPDTAVLDLGAGTFGPTIPGSYDGPDGSAVMYRPGKILRVGGFDQANPNPTCYRSLADSLTVINRAQVLDMTSAAPAWVDVAPPSTGRIFHNLVLLPDGTVLLVGGSRGGVDLPECGKLTPELWNPAHPGGLGDPAAWTSLAPMQNPRLYHSAALLLPDARVLVAGGENVDKLAAPGEDTNGNGVLDPGEDRDGDGLLDPPVPRGEASAEIFSPPYLTTGVTTRPTISSTPGTINYGGTFALLSPNALSITSVALLRPGSVTHGFDENQRYVPLNFVKKKGAKGTLDVTAPANASIAPPGRYMLFVVDTGGVPSKARFVQVGPTAPLGPVCDNSGTCDPGEDCHTCPGDCASAPETGTCISCCGNGVCETAEAPSTCSVDCGVPVRVSSVSVGCVKSGRAWKGRATVMLVDRNTGAPLSGVIVEGSWSGSATGSSLFRTGSNGAGVAYSGFAGPGSRFTFTVTQVFCDSFTGFPCVWSPDASDQVQATSSVCGG